MTGAKEEIVSQCSMCFTSLFLKLETSTLKKPWEEVKHKGVVGTGGGMGRLAYKLPTSVSAPQCAVRGGPVRAMTSGNRLRVPARKSGREDRGLDKDSCRLAKKLPLAYKTSTTTTKWRAIGENVNPSVSSTNPPPPPGRQ